MDPGKPAHTGKIEGQGLNAVSHAESVVATPPGTTASKRGPKPSSDQIVDVVNRISG